MTSRRKRNLKNLLRRENLLQRKPFLNNLTGKPLVNTEEYIEGQKTEDLGEILIRCNNAMYVRGVPEDEEIEDADKD
ncbi:putative small nuclear ribonucleoprotein F [Bienertia sinuspersici]